MPIYQLDIQKQFETEFWTNVYYVDAPALLDARDTGPYFLTAERTFHASLVNFTAVRVRSVQQGDDEYVTNSITLPGLVPTQNADLLPLFNVVRVDLPVSTGRPSRKFYRGVLRDADAQSRVVNPAKRDQIQQALNDLLADLNAVGVAWTDLDGQPITGAAVQVPVAMRQLRRGSRRRLNPIITP